MTYEKKYWSEKEFTLEDGTPYSGYVGISNNEGYIYDTEEKLKKLDSYQTQFNSSSKFFDRMLQEELKLPYSKKEIQFNANDFLYHGTIKQILEKLQANNDYIYQQATISDTLLPAVDDCSVFATTDTSHNVFVNKEGRQFDAMPEFTDQNYQQIKQSLEANYVVNPVWDNSRTDELSYAIEPGEKPRQQYPKKYKFVPNVQIKVELTNGLLKRYSLTSKKTTRTALDPTFYPEKGSTSPYNFNDIVNGECTISKVGIDSDGDKRVKLLLFLAFKEKLVVMRYIFYPDNFAKNEQKGVYDEIDFNGDTHDILTMETIDPSNKNSLNFLEIADLKVHGNYLYVVDSKLNMVLRYDITYLKEEDGQVSWNVKSIRLVDNLQGDGKQRDKIYFNTPNAIDASDDYIYVADSGNGCIKMYSSSFDYVRTIKNGQFTNHHIEAISVNPYEFDLENGTHVHKDSLWIFSTINGSLYLSIIADGRNIFARRIEKIRLLESKYEWDEKFKSVKFSKSNSNYFYVCTTKRVYKIHLSKPSYPFASLSYFKQRILMTTMVWSRIPYKWHILPAGEGDDDACVTWSYRPPSTSAEVLDNRCFCLCACDSMEPCDENGTPSQFNGDIIFHIGNLYNQSKVDTYCKRNNCKFEDIPISALKDMIKCSGIFLYNETTQYISSMSRLNYPCFITEEINDMDPSEYVNAVTFNKMVYKVIYNLVNIKNTLMGHFWGYYNLDELMAFDQMEYDDYFQNLRIKKNHDFFIHDNEPTSIVINRIFEKVWDIQEKFINHMQTRYRAQGAFTNSNFKII